MNIKTLFLKGLLGIYVIAFASLYSQVKGLFGDDGVVPIKDFLKKSSHNEAFNIIQLANKIGLEYGTFLELTCLTSILIAILGLVSKRFITTFTYAFLWFVYFSIHQVGQGFISFRGDLLILEVGFIAALLAPLIPRAKIVEADHDQLSWFLLRWVIFRWFVTSIVATYIEPDQYVYSLKSFPVVAQSVPIPSFINWYLFNLNPKYLAFIQPFQHTLKLMTPFLMVIDLKYSRQFAFYTLLYLSIFQACFDNEGLVHLLVSLCLLSVLKDSYFYKDPKRKQSTFKSIFDISLLIVFFALVAQVIIKFFGASYTNSVVSFKLGFTHEQFKKQVAHILGAVLVAGTFDLITAIYRTYSSSAQKKSPLLKRLLLTVVVLGLFLSSIPNLSKFDQNLERRLLPLQTKEFNRFAASFKLTNGYAVPLKLSDYYANGRLELAIESKESLKDESWDTFNLQYKPSATSKRLPLIVPHLPRLDMKMWYASRSTIANNQWLTTLAYKLATRSEDVLKLIASNNFITKSSHVRVALYTYTFSKSSDADYWNRPIFVREYSPTISVDDLKQLVKSNGVSVVQSKQPSRSNNIEQTLNRYLEISSNYVRSKDQTTIIWTFLGVVLLTLLK